jgi:hypothetical protein
MGHAHFSTTQRYLHHQPRREDAAVLHQAFGGGSDLVPSSVPKRAPAGRTEPTGTN